MHMMKGTIKLFEGAFDSKKTNLSFNHHRKKSLTVFPMVLLQQCPLIIIA